MAKANTLEQWRPHPAVFIYCALAIVLLASACFLGTALLAARWYQPENAVKVALAGVLLFIAALWFSLRRCSTPALPGFRGLLFITSYMTIGVGSLFLLVVILAVVFAILSIIAIALVSFFRNDIAFARIQFRQLVEFYRKHRVYQ